MPSILKLLRPKQWLKNVFVLPPLVFSMHFLEWDYVHNTGLAFLAFCFMASVVYIMNDIFDRHVDSLHPVKKNRPIASGAISVGGALTLAGVLLMGVGGIIWLIPDLIYPLVAYGIMNVFYNVWLKHIPILDIFTIATGFVLRVIAGTVAIGVPSSEWMLLTAMALALFLAGIKRRQELANRGANLRKSLQLYNVAFLDKCVVIFALSTFIFYTLYVVLKNPVLAYTPMPVLFCLLRYMMIMDEGKGEDPTEDLLTDKTILLGGVIWGGMVLFGIMHQ